MRLAMTSSRVSCSRSLITRPVPRGPSIVKGGLGMHMGLRAGPTWACYSCAVTIPPIACGRGRRLQIDGLDLRLHEWGAEGKPGVLLLHSLAAHGHWWDAV